eukprot:4624868-Pleurochrysis_carterae.AAC.2
MAHVGERYRLRRAGRPFTSASTTATSVESTGLGLYHSKQLASILGGRVGYRPNADGGATFVAEVPMALVSANKTEEVIAKNKLDLGLFEIAGAAPEHRARDDRDLHGVLRAGSENALAHAPVVAVAAAVAASEAAAVASSDAAATLPSSSTSSAVTMAASVEASLVGDPTTYAGLGGNDCRFGSG